MGLMAFMRTHSPKRVEDSLSWNVKDKYLALFERARLRNRDFSIICNNCLAGSIYHKFGLPYTSPTVGLYFYSDDYLRMLENFKYYINQPLTFRERSVYPNVSVLMDDTWRFPVGVLGGDVEVEFLHYKSRDEAKQKWERRRQRINFDNLFFVFTDSGAAGAGSESYDFKEEYLERFEALPFRNKVFFSAKPRLGASVVHIKEYEREPYVDNMVVNRLYERYFDVVDWLNMGQGKGFKVENTPRAQIQKLSISKNAN